MQGTFWRLSLRDYFWLLLIAAIGLAWRLDHYQSADPPKRVHPAFLHVRERETTGESKTRRRFLAKLRGQTNEQIANDMEDFIEGQLYRYEYQCYLTEMARRKMGAELQQLHERLKAKSNKAFYRFADNSLLLTALRRAENQPDPLKIHVEFKSPTELVAVVENVDAVREDVFLHEGGDDRSGRRTRWRVQLTDLQGKQIEDSNFDLVGFPGKGGGIGTYGPLSFGEKGRRHNTLEVRKYVSPPPSGVYHLQVIHGNDDIAHEPDLEGLIVWKSAPIKVKVTNQAGGKGFSALPLLLVIPLMGLVSLVLAVRRFWRRGKSGGSSTAFRLRFRDRLAISVVVLLLIGWQFDRAQLAVPANYLIHQDQAKWSLRSIE